MHANIDNLKNKSKDELINEIIYLKEIVHSYDKTDSRNIDLGITKVDLQNVFYNIMKHMPVMFYIKDKKHRFIIANDAVAKHVGAKSTQRIIGKTDYDLYPRKMADEFMTEEKNVMSSGEPLIDKRDMILSPDNGNRKWIMSTKIPLRSQEGSIIGIIGISHDVSAVKKLDDDKTAVIEALKKAIGEIRTLSGLLPICASCKKIRDDDGYWHKLELYLHDKTHAELTHGLCPDCAHHTVEEFRNSEKNKRHKKK